MLPQKRSRPDPGPPLPKLMEAEFKIYEAIKSREGSGIWTQDVKKAVIGLSPVVINKALKSLLSKNLIKEVTSIKNVNKKMVMGVEFEPSEEISGGTWYNDGELDLPFIKILRQQCMRHIENQKITTCEKIQDGIRASAVFNMDIGLQQISQIVELLVLDNEVQRLRSTGAGEFSHILKGNECFRVLKGQEGKKEGAFSSIPCGVCPRISECSPDGDISPINCIYYNKWLGIDF